MKNIIIRELKTDDMDKIANLLRTREELDEEGAKKRRRLFEWLAFNNPFADGEPTYFVAQDRGKIVAHLGRMPTEFIIKGKRQKGYFIHDLYVHPEYRKKGMGFFLSMSLYKVIENNSGSFCCSVWTSKLNLEMLRRRGHYELWARRYVKLINPSEKLGKFLKPKFLVVGAHLILKGILFLGDLIFVSLVPSEAKVTKIDKFDSQCDTLNEKVSNKIGISSYKEINYLNWKYIDRPFSKLDVLAAKENGQLEGFVVVAADAQSGYLRGSIVDIVADPEDTRTIASLFKAAIDYFKEKKVYSINCCMTDKRFVKILKRFLFLKPFSGEPVMLANIEKAEEKEYLIDINNWHVTYGASDGFMLMP